MKTDTKPMDFDDFPKNRIFRPNFRKNEKKSQKSGSYIFLNPSSTLDCAAQIFQRPSEIRVIRVGKIDFFEMFSPSHCNLYRVWISQIQRNLMVFESFRVLRGAMRCCSGPGRPEGGQGCPRHHFRAYWGRSGACGRLRAPKSAQIWPVQQKIH